MLGPARQLQRHVIQLANLILARTTRPTMDDRRVNEVLQHDRYDASLGVGVAWACHPQNPEWQDGQRPWRPRLRAEMAGELEASEIDLELGRKGLKQLIRVIAVDAEITEESRAWRHAFGPRPGLSGD
jgi:hypothetical protein